MKAIIPEISDYVKCIMRRNLYCRKRVVYVILLEQQ